MARKIDVLIMAAGGSRRFGGCKLLADFRGAPLLSYAVNAALELSCTQPEVISSVNVALGGYASEIRGYLKQWSDQLNLFDCPDWGLGLGHSLAFGVGQLPAENSVLIMLGDQPLIDVVDLENLIVAAGESSGSIVCSAFASTVGVPAVFSAVVKPSLLQLRGDKGAKSLLVKGQGVVGVPISSAEVDIDWRADLRK